MAISISTTDHADKTRFEFTITDNIVEIAISTEIGTSKEDCVSALINLDELKKIVKSLEKIDE